MALLDELGFVWNGMQKISVTEQCLEANSILYVLGTLGQRKVSPGAGNNGNSENGRTAQESDFHSQISNE